MGKAAKRLLAGALATAVACTTVISSDMTALAAEKKAKATKIAGSTYTTADLIWEDNFDGDALNTKYWNYEAHEPGWVNAEWQSYPSQKENEKTGNIYVKDGKLTIQAKKTKNADGTYSYTSGRVNTQNKVDTKYGRFEARIKMPRGKGFLPAFWMMPTDENLYGQWPKCGEIDITEVHGSQPDTAYSTLHFGEPHTQRQNTYTLKKSDFSKDFHVYACEWEPGEIRFYIDNKLFYTVNDWFTKKEGFDEVTYPAPFDQPYYIILNLAVGGSWVGYPDETTAFGDNAQMVVDYVKVYQKDSYKETVKKPENTVKLRKPDKSGNYVVNSNFAKAEKLNDGKNWEFLLAGTGDASAKISKNALHITTKNAGDLDYSVQVVQPNIPMEQGYQYKLSFDAYADKNRTMITAITAPDNGYIRYFNDTKVNLTTKKKTYSYTFDMKSATDANGRVEFNLGNQGSTAGVHITNVKVVKVKKISTKEEKSVRPDGNYVYNGEFQEGADRLNYWTVKKAKGASVKVTNTNNVRQLKAVVPASVKKASDVTVKQTKVAVKGGKSYVLSFDAKRTGAKDQTLIVKIAGKTYKAKLTGSMKTYKFELKPKKGTKNATLEFQLGTKGTTYIDNVRIMENGLIINGDFSAGMTGFEAWANNPSDVSYVVDTLKEDSAFSMDIKDTGDQDWHIQLKQTGVKLEKGQNYKISFKAKATTDRDIKFVFQRNGLKRKNADGSEDWTVYFSDEQILVTKKWQTYSAVFEMKEDTDADTSMSFNFGAIGGKRITDKHTVLIDDIVLEKTDEKVKEEEDDSLIINGHFTKGLSPFETWAHDSAKMESGVDNDKVFYATIYNTGSEDWHAQLKQVNIPLEKGQYYTFSFRAKSDLDRNIKYAFQKDGNKHGDDWTVYFEESNIPVTKEWKTYTAVFKMEKDTDKESSFSFNLGAVGKQIKDKHTVMIDDVVLRVATEEEKKEAKNANAGGGGGGGDNNPPVVTPPTTKPDAVVSKLDATTINNSIIKNNPATNASATVADGKTKIKVETAGSNASDIQVPVAQVSNVKPDQVNKITIKASKGTGSMLSLRSARLRAGGDVTVKFAIKFGSSDPEILKSADDVEDIVLGDTSEEKVLFYQGTNATVQTPKILCYVGTVPANTTVVIDNIDVKQAVASEIPNNMSVLENSKFDGSYSKWDKSIVAPGSGSISFSAGKAITTVNNPGTADWNVQLKQMELPLAVEGNYKVTFKAKSTKARTIKASVMAVSGDKYAWLNGADVLLKENAENEVTFYIKNVPAKMNVGGVDVDIANANKGIFFSMGMITDEGYIAEDTPASTIEISDLSVTKVATTGTDSQSNPGTKPNHGTTGGNENAGVTIGADLLAGITVNDGIFKDGAAGTVEAVGANGVKIKITNSGNSLDNIEIAKESVVLEKGAKYTLSYDIKVESTDVSEWYLGRAMLDPKNGYSIHDDSMGWGESVVVGNTENKSADFTAKSDGGKFFIQLGHKPAAYGDIERNILNEGQSVIITISNLKVSKIANAPEGNQEESPGAGEGSTLGDELIGNGAFSGNIDGTWKAGEKSPEIEWENFDGNGVLKATISGSPVNAWDTQVCMYAAEKLDNNSKYQLSFKIKGTSTYEIIYGVQKNSGDYSKYKEVTCNISNEWQTVSAEITTDGTADSAPAAIFFFIGKAAQNDVIYIDDISLKKVVEQ
ncbi:MAG: carbohydrate binding domain-containing protein [Lachnospiraceae bacterium]